MRILTLIFSLGVVTVSATHVNRKIIAARQNCGSNYSKCSPPGATNTGVPAIGDELSSLYVNVLDSINGVKFNDKRAVDHMKHVEAMLVVRSSAQVCCADGTTCLNLENLNTPFCYDHFTTDYYLADGSYGTITSGNYTSSDGSVANLLTGNYSLTSGGSGNIYSSNGSVAPPNTATLTIPTQYTASGSGSAIPASLLGGEATFTTTIPGTTIQPSTASPTTITTSIVVSGSTAVSTTTMPASTLPGTTVAPKTETVTTHVSGAAASKTGAAQPNFCENTLMTGAAGFGLILFTLFGI